MKPGLKRIIVGALLMVAAFVIPFVMLFPIIFEKPEEIVFKVPGTAEMTIAEPGRFYLWNNHRIYFDGVLYDRSEHIPNTWEIKIRDANGDFLEFVSSGSMSVTTGNRSKVGLGYVDIEDVGTVMIEVLGGNDEGVFSLSRMELLKMMRKIGGIIGGALLLGLLGLVLVIWGSVKLVNAGKAASPPPLPLRN